MPLAAAAVSVLWGVVVMFRLILVSSTFDDTCVLGPGELLASVDMYISVSVWVLPPHSQLQLNRQTACSPALLRRGIIRRRGWELRR